MGVDNEQEWIDEKLTAFGVDYAPVRELLAEYRELVAKPLEDRVAALEGHVSRLMHTYCECGDEFTNVSESHYMIIENGKCVNCRCASGDPLEIKDEFLNRLHEVRKRKLTAAAAIADRDRCL